jgi:hypothetical protein
MSRPEVKRKVRCAVYTRKSSEEGLEQSFNSLDAQRARPARPTSTASAMKAGSRSTIGTMMADTAAARLSGRRCSG